MNLPNCVIFFCCLFLCSVKVCSQQQDTLQYKENADTISTANTILNDSMQRIAQQNLATIKPLKPIALETPKQNITKKKSPAIAAVLSTILPASGLVYVNYKDWKYWAIHIPITYGVLGYMIWRLTYNLNYYNITNYGYQALASGDSARIANISPLVKPITDITVMKNYRDQFRQSIDMNALFLAIFWGLNIVDAAVEAHLSNFNVSKDLTLKLAPIDGFTMPTLTPSFTLCSFQYKWQYKKPYGVSLW